MNLRSRWPVALVGLLLILLPLLAALQYQWIGQVSVAERGRLANSLRVSTIRFADDYATEIAGIFMSLQLQGGLPESPDVVLERYRLWESSAAYPQLIKALYFIKFDPVQLPALYHLNPTSGSLEPTTWPQEWEGLTSLATGPPNLAGVTGTFGFLSPARPPNPPPRTAQRRRFGPLLEPDNRLSQGWWLVELNRDVLVMDVLSALAERHFGEHDNSVYRIGIVVGGALPEVVFSSDGSWTREDLAMPDAFADLSAVMAQRPNDPPRTIGLPETQGQLGPFGPPRPMPPPRTFARGPVAGGLRGTEPTWPTGPPLLMLGQPLRLVVKHRLGGLETAVEQVRQRNLVVSFGILLVLGAAVIAVVVSSLRARTLGKLQMDFAAGVSHELRTPIAVIQSAAYNLQSGAVSDKKAIEEYAGILQDESRRLSDMVNQVLLFAETQSGPGKYQVAPVDLRTIIDRAIRNFSSAHHRQNHEIMPEVEPELPHVMANAAALTQCLQNLLSNAAKYGKEHGFARIRILASRDRDRREVQVTVADEGSGIAAADSSRLFEPFYRGVNVSSSVPGNGLGLHLVKRLMESQGGRVTFGNNPGGKGAYFRLHIRAESTR